MSKGGGKTTTVQSNKIDPALMKLYNENYASAKAIANKPYESFGQDFVADASPALLEAQGLFGDIARSNIGTGTLNNAIGAASGVAAYTPQNVSSERLSMPYLAPGYTPQTVSTGSVTDQLPLTAADYNPQQISAGLLSDTDLSAYMNPYIQNVIANTLANNETARLGARTADQQKATAAGAFGGSRSGVMGSLTNAAYDKNALTAVSGLLSDGYNNAQQAALADIGNRLTADQSNQNAGLQDYGLDIQNLGQGQNTLLADLARQLTAQQSNQQAGLQGAQLDLQNYGQAQQAETSDLARLLAAQQSNQQAGLQGAGLNLQGAGLLGDLSNQELSQATSKAGLLEGVGLQQQQQQQAEIDALLAEFMRAQNYPIEMQQLLSQALGMMPQQGTTTTKSSGGGDGGGSVIQGLGSIGSALLSAGAFSDENLKADIQTVRHDGRGRRWVNFRYLWDAPGTIRHGVIAQEVEKTDPRAVINTMLGKMVDYSQLEAS